MSRQRENKRKRKENRCKGQFKGNTVISNKTIYLPVYGYSYREVKEKINAINQMPDFKLPNKNNECKFSEVLRLWMKINRLKHKGATETKYEYLIENHIIPKLGQYKLSAINTLILNDFMEEKLKSGRLDHKGGLSVSYVRSIMLIITSALKFAADEQLCVPLKTPVYRPVTEKKNLTVLSQREQQRFESQLLVDTDMTKLGVLISLNTGLRIGEICSLLWDDIDLKTKIIHVRSTVTRIKNKDDGKNIYSLIIDKPKTVSSIRDIPIQSRLLPVLENMKKTAKSKYVISDTDSFLSPRTYEYRFHKLLNVCNIKSINYHVLRHTFATRCIEVGVDVKTLSEILGHADVSVTLNTYVHPSMELKRSQLEKLSNISA